MFAIAARIGQSQARARVSAPLVSPSPTFKEAFRFWLKLGFISFGGPAGQIAIMHEELVVRRKWISEARFLHALNFCMLLPGPEAQQLATYIGWLLHRTRGGLVAGAFFVLPAAVILWVLSWAYVTYGQIVAVAAVFHGLKAAVLAIVAAAAIRIGRRVLQRPLHWTVALAAFAALFVFELTFPLVVLGAALLGLSVGVWLPAWIAVAGEHESPISLDPQSEEPAPAPTWRRSLAVLVIGLALWWLPVLGLKGWLGTDHTLVREGVFFSQAAMVTFGGAYAVLPYVGQQAVEEHGWLSAAQMMDGLGLAETTPGPLVMVLQFVGFVGGWQHPGGLSPLLAATLGAGITTWVTFVPCFLWIFLGAPYVERLRKNRHLTGALSAITAAVVGVILNLAVWFGQHALWVNQQIDWFVLVTGAIAFTGLWRWRWNVLAVAAGCGATGWLWSFVR